MTHALIVDDDVDSATSLRALVANEPFTVAMAHTLRDARRQIALQQPEIVLLDCRAKLQQAYAVAAELRAAVLEQVGKDQTDRLRDALNRSITILE